MSALCRWNEVAQPPTHSAQAGKSSGKERSDDVASVTDVGEFDFKAFIAAHRVKARYLVANK